MLRGQGVAVYFLVSVTLAEVSASVSEALDALGVVVVVVARALVDFGHSATLWLSAPQSRQRLLSIHLWCSFGSNLPSLPSLSEISVWVSSFVVAFFLPFPLDLSVLFVYCLSEMDLLDLSFDSFFGLLLPSRTCSAFLSQYRMSIRCPRLHSSSRIGVCRSGSGHLWFALVGPYRPSKGGCCRYNQWGLRVCKIPQRT